MHLVLVGTSHHRAPVELREQLYVTAPENPELVRRLAGEEGEAVALSTCNRTELYVVDDDPEVAQERAFAELAALSGLAESEIAPSLYTLADEAAAMHLFRVAASLDSMIPGEAQILGQVRRAYETAKDAGTAGRIVHRLFRQALRVGRRVRSETAIGENPASISSAAAELAERVFGSLEGRRILVLGAGKMSDLATVNLISRGVESVFVANRSVERAEKLARRFGGRAAGLDAVEAELEDVDIVVASTGARGHVLSAEQVERAMRKRKGRPIFFVDIAVPRDIDPGRERDRGLLPLRRRRPRARRRGERGGPARGGRARRGDRRGGGRGLPRLAALPRRRSGDRVAPSPRRVDPHDRARACGRAPQLASPSERRAVESLTAQIVNKLLHAPTVRMKQAAAAADGVLYADAVRHLFDLDDRDSSARQPGE